jgi:hypothetical protein
MKGAEANVGGFWRTSSVRTEVVSLIPFLITSAYPALS